MTFYTAKDDYEKALEAGLNAESVLMRHNELTENEMNIIRKSFGNNIKHESQIINKKKIKLDITSEKQIVLAPIDSYKEIEFICKRLKLAKGQLATVVAEGGSGKSLFLQYFTLCVAYGYKLFDKFDVQKGKVLHIDLEQSERLTSLRYSRIAKGMGITKINNINRICIGRIDDSADLDDVRDQLIELFSDYTVVVIDSLKKLSTADENTADIEPIVNMIRICAEKANVLVMMIHHKGKSSSESTRQSGRGHSSIYDSVDIQIDLQHDPRDKTGLVKLSCAKNREGSNFDGIEFRFFDNGNLIKSQDCTEELCFECLNEKVNKETKADEFKLKILNSLNDNEKNLNSLFTSLKGDRNAYAPILESLKEEGLISERTGAKNSKIYSITKEGFNYISFNK